MKDPTPPNQPVAAKPLGAANPAIPTADKPSVMLITTSTFPAGDSDGTPRFVADLATALAAHATVEVLAPDAPYAVKSEFGAGVHVTRFSYFWPRRAQRLAPGMLDNLRSSWLARLQVPGFLIAEVLATTRMLLKLRPEYLNAHWVVPQGLVAAALRRIHSTRLILHAHAGDVDLLARLPLGRSVARFVVNRSSAVFTASAQVRERLDQLLGRPSGARVRSMGADLSRFGNADPMPSPFAGGYLLFVGRLVPKKGINFLLEAMSELRDVPGLGLIVVGGGPQTSELKSLTATLDLTDRVHFVGPQSHTGIARYLAGCVAFIVPSIVDDRGETEGLPTVIFEAMAAGAPVVASAVAGIPEVVRPGETGWLCEPRSPKGIAAAIRDVMADGHSAEITAKARSAAAAYSWESVAADYLAVMKEIEPR